MMVETRMVLVAMVVEVVVTAVTIKMLLCEKWWDISGGNGGVEGNGEGCDGGREWLC